MAFKLAEAYVELNSRGFGGVSQVIDQVSNKALRMGSIFSGVLPAITAGLGAVGLGVGVVGMVKAAAEAESTAISFEVLLGSATAAKKMLQELNHFAAATPFDFPGLSEAAKTLLAFGINGNEVMDDIRMISDVAQGDGQRLRSLALVLGQISAAGRLTGQDLLQLVNVGFNPLQVISEKTGESVASLRDKMSDGLITFDMVKNAFKSATSEGGLFFQMNEKQSQTLVGLWSTLGDNVGMGLRDTGTAIVEAFDLKDLLRGSIEFTDGFRTAIQPLISEIVPSVRDLMDSLAGAFGFAWGQMTGATGSGVDFVIEGLREIGGWAVFLMDTTAFVVNNWGLLWAVAYENAALTFRNIVEQVKTFGINAIEIGMWFFENWKSIFVTLGDFTVAVFQNLAQNIQAALQPVQTSIAEMMLRASAAITGTSAEELEQQIATLHEDAARRQVPFTGLLEGFQSSINQMPELTRAAVQSTSPELEYLNGLLGENALAAGFGLTRDPPKSYAKAAEEEQEKSRSAGTGSSSSKAGAIVSLSELSRGVQQAAVKKAEQFAEKTADATAKIASAVGADGKMKVQTTTAVIGP